MNKNNESWYWNNIAAVTLTLIVAMLVAMLALCCWLAPDRSKKVTVYQDGNLAIQCIEKKAGACERVTIKDKGVNNDRK